MVGADMMTRNSRMPTFILVGLLVVISIISYNYWITLQSNNDLKQQLITLEEKYTDLTSKKTAVDKQVEINENRIKFFEQRAETNQQAMNKKDEEMTELNKKLKDAEGEISKLKTDNEESGNKLKACDENKTELDKVKEEKAKLTEENTKLNTQVTELSDKLKISTNCEIKEKGIVANAFIALYKEYTDEKMRAKFKEVFNIDESTLKQLNIDEAPKDVKREASEATGTSSATNGTSETSVAAAVKDICSLAKSEGKCTGSFDKYYYDSSAKACATFKYTGCDGNENNFDTLEACEKECVKKSEAAAVVEQQPTAGQNSETKAAAEQQPPAQLPSVDNDKPVAGPTLPSVDVKPEGVHDDNAAAADDSKDDPVDGVVDIDQQKQPVEPIIQK